MRLLDLLSDGQWHSGEALGNRLGVSRAAVWKQLQTLKEHGVRVDAVPGRGYRLVDALDSWSRQALLAVIGDEFARDIAELRIERRVSSTNDIVASRTGLLTAGMVVCLADEQTCGRGRRGREWYSPFNGSFYGTVGCRFTEGIAAVGGLSLAVGLVVAKALRQLGVEGVQLKWPNDLEVGGAKLGGVLIELQAEADGPCNVIVGVGVNLKLPHDAAAAIGREVIDVASCVSGAVDRNRLGGLIVRGLIELLRHYPLRGFLGVKAEWEAFDSLRGCEVVITGVEPQLKGVVRGVDDSGALLLTASTGQVSVHSGEVSVRKTCA